MSNDCVFSLKKSSDFILNVGMPRAFEGSTETLSTILTLSKLEQSSTPISRYDE